MNCPVCNRKIRTSDALFSMLPFWMRCKGCKAKLTLDNKRLFWTHLGVFLATMLAIWLVLSVSGSVVLLEITGIFELTVYLFLLLTVLLGVYGFKPIR